MDKQQLIRRLMVTFLAEFEEHVRALDRDLLELERRPDGPVELLETLFRTVHSLKGAARSVNVGSVEAVCHRLETLLSGARSSRAAFEPEVIDLLFASADGLRDASERLRDQRDLAAGPLPALLLRLDGRPSTDESPTRSAPRSRSTDGFVRVPAEKLDTLLTRSGELLVARRRAATRHEDVRTLVELLSRVESQASGSDSRDRFLQLARGLDSLATQLELDQHLLDQAAAGLEDEVKRVRMLPFRDACEGLDRVVRDLAHDDNKRVELGVEGGMVELDRSILDGLTDPLLQLVRNAVAHGLEAQHERMARGKPATGRVTVSASLRGVGVEIVVADDGRGLDLAKIREQASRRGLAVANDGELARLVFLPGFSTAGSITELSGRGVGLDVVKHRVESLHGTVDVESTPEVGARFVMTLPLTLTTVRALLVESGHQVFALPSSSVQRLVRVAASELGSIEGRDVWLGGGAPVAVASLAHILGLDSVPIRLGGTILIVVIAMGGKRIGLAVDEFVAEQDFVVKSLGPRLRQVLHFSGATFLPTGRIALILNPSDLLAAGMAARSLGLAADDEVAFHARRLLIVDDSVTTRTLEKSILESAGFDVIVATDGTQAWRLLQTVHVDLVVADVQMPSMDGVALTVAIRGSKRLGGLPVILVTALETDEDKARGLEAGADAYLPKSTFDQTVLLQTIAQLL